MNVFKEANNKLENFIQNHLDSYHLLRNYDYGEANRTNVSQISKYTSHRILYEYEIIEKLKTVDSKKKFTDEILWRIYWKGYLENYKSIWFEYLSFKNNSFNSSDLNNAKVGKTGIECFDSWIEELRENNYLHNHARMWFASIWIFTLRLPWQLGARLFMQHLLDGDSASNTLSWRWVAGMHTNKKPYIASNQNINKFTSNRFKNTNINTLKQINIIKSNQHQANKIPIQRNSSKSKVIFMFDNDLNILNRTNLFNSYSKVYILFNQIIESRIKLCENVINFKLKLLEHTNKLIPNSEIIFTSDLDIILDNFNCIDVIYPSIGNNLDLINKFSNYKKININFIYRHEDITYWRHAKSGYNKFKNSFYSKPQLDNNLYNPKRN